MRLYELLINCIPPEMIMKARQPRAALAMGNVVEQLAAVLCRTPLLAQMKALLALAAA